MPVCGGASSNVSLPSETHSPWDVLEVTLSEETLMDEHVLCPRARTCLVVFSKMSIPMDSGSLFCFLKAHAGDKTRMVLTGGGGGCRKVICDPDGFLCVLMEVDFEKQACSHAQPSLHSGALSCRWRPFSLRWGWTWGCSHQRLHTRIEVHVKDFHVGLSRWRPCDFFAPG